MKIDLTKKEWYFVEKMMDNFRDDMLKGISQQMNLIQSKDIPNSFKELVKKNTNEYVKTYDYVNTICAKLSQWREDENKDIKSIE